MTRSGPARPRVLVVDDNPAVRDLWDDALALLGYDVAAASDGTEALALFEAAPYDVVLTDLAMPGMDGWTLAEAIWARSSVPVILMTGHARDADLARARASGAVLLLKPVPLTALERAVEQTLRGRA